MKNFLEIPMGGFFKTKTLPEEEYKRISYERTESHCTFNAVNKKGRLCFFEDNSKVIELEPCEGGFREKKPKFSELAPGTLYKHHEDAKVWKKLPNQDIAYNSIDKDGYISICCEESLVIVCEKWK